MKEKICEFFNGLKECPVVERVMGDDFICGMITGIAVYIVIVLLVHLVFIICRRRKKCSELLIQTEKGVISISLKAVTAALKAELSSFAQLEVVRIVIFYCKKDYIFEIRSRFLPGNSDAPELYAALENNVKEYMKNTFGIENIVRVDLRIDGCVEKDDAKSENDGFIDAVM